MIKRILIMLMVVMVINACDDDEHVNIKKITDRLRNDTAQVQIAVLPTLDCMPLLVACERGFFDKYNMGVGVRYYTAQMDCDTAFTRGWVNVMVSDLVRTERLRQLNDSTMPIGYVTATDAYWQLLSTLTARVHFLYQLDNKMMAMTRFSVTHLLSDYIMEMGKLKPERMFMVQVNDLNVRADMMQTGIMDALFLPEPQATLGRLSHCYKLYDTRMTDMHFGVVAANTRVIGHERMQVLRKVYNEACDSLNERGLAHYEQLLHDFYNLNQQCIDSLPDDYHFCEAAPPADKDVSRARQWLNDKQMEYSNVYNLK